jgi:hypothetical protein
MIACLVPASCSARGFACCFGRAAPARGQVGDHEEERQEHLHLVIVGTVRQRRLHGQDRHREREARCAVEDAAPEAPRLPEHEPAEREEDDADPEPRAVAERVHDRPGDVLLEVDRARERTEEGGDEADQERTRDAVAEDDAERVAESHA